jgi:MoaA/NifB/PqqE/SkfB family radical SAM enzyme
MTEPVLGGAGDGVGDTKSVTAFKWLDFKITNRCNRRCVYCGVSHDSPNAPELLPSEAIARALKEALEVGFTHFALLGGEPSLREDIQTIFGPFHGTLKPKSLMVITNGVRFNEELYRSLFSSDAEEAILVFSMDSFSRPNYKFQDPDASLGHIRAIQRLAKEYDGRNGRRRVSIHTVVSRENFQNMTNLVKIFHDMELDVSMGLVCPSRFMDGGNPKAYNEFTFAELDSILGQLEELDRSGSLEFANRTLRDYLRVYPYGKLQMSSTCRAGRQAVIINSDGSVFPCISQSYLGGHSFGNVGNESFACIYRRMETFVCTWKESPACWDHFLWDRMALESQ